MNGPVIGPVRSFVLTGPVVSCTDSQSMKLSGTHLTVYYSDETCAFIAISNSIESLVRKNWPFSGPKFGTEVEPNSRTGSWKHPDCHRPNETAIVRKR